MFIATTGGKRQVTPLYETDTVFIHRSHWHLGPDAPLRITQKVSGVALVEAPCSDFEALKALADEMTSRFPFLAHKVYRIGHKRPSALQGYINYARQKAEEFPAWAWGTRIGSRSLWQGDRV